MIGVVASAAVGGFRLGFVARVTSWIGLAAGIVGAAWLAPRALEWFPGGDAQTRLLIAVAVFLFLTTAGASVGAMAGSSMRRLLPPGTGVRQVDRVGGAVLGGVGAAVFVWLLIPTLAEVPGVVSQLARNSTIARGVDRYAPEPQALQNLRRQVAEVNFPQVFSRLGPSPTAGPPPGDVAIPVALRNRVAASTVKVTGTACGRVLSGSGFAPAADTIVTNAHVVAGVSKPSVLRPDGRRLPATVEVFDPRRDLAVLRVNGLGDDPLPVAVGSEGDEGAVFGHPNGQDELAIIPARIETKLNAQGMDLYGTSQTRREIFVLAAALVPGDSGGALVDTAGEVVGVAFAVAPDKPSTSYALTSTELRAVLNVPRQGTADTGACLRG
ncbi:MAG: MarP family serine protease [Actinomycetota bacterium]|nr:MarP family serine protease [Actinomycetota bacterium]